MKLEEKLLEYISDTKYDDLPEKPIDIVKAMVLINLGSLIAGSKLNECTQLVNTVKEWGGKPEASILIHKTKVPGYNAALANGTMCRVLDFGDAIAPGIHIGPVAVPASLAAVEMAGGCSGKEYLSSLIIGAEIASRINRLNLKGHVNAYNGFKPTGVCSIFAGTVAAGRILGLNTEKMSNALGIVFNRAGGSIQGNIEGTQTVALVAGFAAQNSVVCTELARKGFTGPRDFLEGIYGYIHLYANDNIDAQIVTGELGKRFELSNTLFKQYPQCGMIQTSTQAILELVRDEGLIPENIANITIWIQPSAYKDVGHFDPGNSARQSAQFSLKYCVASALLRKSSQFQHFEADYIREPRIVEIVKKIELISSPDMEKRDQTSMDMEVKTKAGVKYRKSIDTPRGFPGNPMTKEEYATLFQQCVDYSNKEWIKERADSIYSTIENLERLNDVRSLVSLLCQ